MRRADREREMHRAARRAYEATWELVWRAARDAARAGLPESVCPYQRPLPGPVRPRVGDVQARLEWLSAYDLEREAMAREASA